MRPATNTTAAACITLNSSKHPVATVGAGHDGALLLTLMSSMRRLTVRLETTITKRSVLGQTRTSNDQK